MGKKKKLKKELKRAIFLLEQQKAFNGEIADVICTNFTNIHENDMLYSYYKDHKESIDKKRHEIKKHNKQSDFFPIGFGADVHSRYKEEDNV